MRKIILISLFVCLINCKSNNSNCIDESNVISKAESEFKNIYGNDILKYKPFLINKKNDSTWIISGSHILDLGGVPQLEINPKNCEISKVTHGK